MAWEKRFNLSLNGATVLAEYARMKTYHLEFKSQDEAELFIKEFKSAQEQIKTNGKLTTRVAIVADTGNATIGFTFEDLNASIKMKCKFESVQEMYMFYGQLRDQILKYS